MALFHQILNVVDRQSATSLDPVFPELLGGPRCRTLTHEVWGPQMGRIQDLKDFSIIYKTLQDYNDLQIDSGTVSNT